MQVKVIGGLAGNTVLTSVDRGTEFDQHVSYITSMIGSEMFCWATGDSSISYWAASSLVWE